MSLNPDAGDAIDYAALARALIVMSPIQRRILLQIVRVMKSKFWRAAITAGTILTFVAVMLAAERAGVSPGLAWALIITGGALAIVIILKALKIL